MGDTRVTLKDNLKKELEEIAKSFGVSASEYLRGLLIHDLKKKRFK